MGRRGRVTKGFPWVAAALLLRAYMRASASTDDTWVVSSSQRMCDGTYVYENCGFDLCRQRCSAEPQCVAFWGAPQNDGSCYLALDSCAEVASQFAAYKVWYRPVSDIPWARSSLTRKCDAGPLRPYQGVVYFDLCKALCIEEDRCVAFWGAPLGDGSCWLTYDYCTEVAAAAGTQTSYRVWYRPGSDWDTSSFQRACDSSAETQSLGLIGFDACIQSCIQEDRCVAIWGSPFLDGSCFLAFDSCAEEFFSHISYKIWYRPPISTTPTSSSETTSTTTSHVTGTTTSHTETTVSHTSEATVSHAMGTVVSHMSGDGSAAVVQVVAEYTADETLPLDVKESDLMSSIVYKTAKKKGLEVALSVPASDLTITGFALGARRLSTAVRRLSDTVSVTTSFEVKTASTSAATAVSTRIAGASAAIKAATDSAMAEADWSGESVITVAPTMTAPTVANPTLVAITISPTTTDMATRSSSTASSTTTVASTAGESQPAATVADVSSADTIVIVVAIAGASFVIAVLMAVTFLWNRGRRLAASPAVMGDVVLSESEVGNGNEMPEHEMPEQPPVVMQDVSDRSRMLGISLEFAIRIFPDEAREMKGRLLKQALSKPVRSTVEDRSLTVADTDVHHLNFIELADIVAHGEVAYGKGIICPRDGKLDCSIVDAVHSRGASARATMFLSWFWQYKLSLVLSALRKYQERQAHPEKCFLWWCFFGNNQFRILGSKQQQDFFTLKAVFSTQLRNVGRMVALMDKVADSRYVSRLWCLFEVYTVSTEKLPFEVVLPESASVEIDKLLKGGLGQLKSAITVDSKKAKASFAEDENNIKSMIESMQGTYSTLDTAVRNELQRVVMHEIGLALRDS
ncbi:unnamed protein product [Prorocentrum cordatum]|uniref:Uncharacterized protein n=1 Tax=Prorocentrum cordatum TaxID=2364126 RepID=A0ABN9QC56_9DINO|nr:unnamed protein product [Polarella glacialis]